MIYVIKKTGIKEPWNDEKVREAVRKAADRCSYDIDNDELGDVCRCVQEYVYRLVGKPEEISTEAVHQCVIQALIDCELEHVSEAYSTYHMYRKATTKAFEEIKEEADRIIYRGDKENANFDSSLISTKKSLIGGFLCKQLFKQYHLDPKTYELCKRGDIYIHDLRDMLLGSFNCCLFDMDNVLKGGFELSNIHYSEPNSVLSALQVIGDVMLCATGQQFGGFTVPSIDNILLYYIDKDRKNGKGAAQILHELKQGFQALEVKLNTIPSSRGDFSFTTLTFGAPPTYQMQWDTIATAAEWQETIIKTLLDVRMQGHGGKPVVFPKLVYLHDKDYIDAYPEAARSYEKSIECSSQLMYPDYLSLRGDGVVADLYKRTGVITHMMGCRAYLTPWKDEKTDKYITTGRCNIGAVSLNLPLIFEVARHEGNKFFDVLDDRLEVIRNFLKSRYEFLAKQPCSTNPLFFTQGGGFEGNGKYDEPIGNRVRWMTASFGITALHELCKLATGDGIVNPECRKFAIKVVRHIKNKVEEFKKEDGYLYALYGTPAESLCQTQAKQYAKYCRYHDIYNVLGNKKYFTNSFHCWVGEDITPFEKQDAEYTLFHLINGGHIQYVRLTDPANVKATKAIIDRGMECGFYQGVNFEDVYCNTCGKHSHNTGGVCPHCGSSDVDVIDRVSGYLGYSKLHGDTRINEGKMDEIKDRVCM